MNKKRQNDHGMPEKWAYLLCVGVFIVLWSFYGFIKTYQTEVIIFLLIVIVAFFSAVTIVSIENRKRQAAEAKGKKHRSKIRHENSNKSAVEEQQIEEQRRRVPVPFADSEKQQLEKAKQNDWRKKEKLPADTKLFKVSNTVLYSTYPPVMTDGEINIVNRLVSIFNMHHILVDSYFWNPGGSTETAQVDVIAVGTHGVFVFESKDYSGRIFGKGRDHTWTQVFGFGHTKKTFQCPNSIRQNQSHINVLKQKLGNQNIPFFSIIVFGCKADITNIRYVPKGVFVITEHRLNDALNDLQKEPELLTAAQVFDIVATLKRERIVPSTEIREKHIANIKDMLGEERVYR